MVDIAAIIHIQVYRTVTIFMQSQIIMEPRNSL